MNTAMPEIWLPVVGLKGFYEVSNLGQVRSIAAPGSRRSGRVLKFRPTHDGYLRVNLYHDGGRHDAYVATLVAEAFIGPKPPGMEIRHGSTGKTDNRPENLAYGYHIENCEDRARDKAGHAKLTRVDAREIRSRVAAGESMRTVAETYGVNYNMIDRIVLGQRWVIEAASD